MPDAALDLFEYYEGNEDAADPVVTTWLVASGRVGFAGLQFVRRKPWLVSGELRTNDTSGLLKLVQMSVKPWKHDAELTGAVLRALRLAELREHAFADLVWKGDEPVIFFGEDQRGTRIFPEEEKADRADLLKATPRRRPGRPPRPDSHYRRIALTYLHLYARGMRKGILRELGKELGVSWQAARDGVARARQLGYLSPGTPGRAGATTGPLLSEQSRVHPQS